jgi:hypothetical protein
MVVTGAVCLGLVSCDSIERANHAGGDVSGTYVREYTIDVPNMNSGGKLGIRQVRDSIFVKHGNNGYEVSNRKWRMNDYDQDGWVSMAHADDRPLPTFFASYDERSERLNPDNSDISKPIFIDTKGNKLLMNSAKNIVYIKIN